MIFRALFLINPEAPLGVQATFAMIGGAVEGVAGRKAVLDEALAPNLVRRPPGGPGRWWTDAALVFDTSPQAAEAVERLLNASPNAMSGRVEGEWRLCAACCGIGFAAQQREHAEGVRDLCATCGGDGANRRAREENAILFG